MTYKRRPSFDVFAHKRRVFPGTIAHGCGALGFQLIAQLRPCKSGDDSRIEFFGDCIGEISWREDAEPCDGLKPGHGLPNRRQIRKQRLSFVTRHTIGAQFARANLLGSRDQADEHEIDLSAQHFETHKPA